MGRSFSQAVGISDQPDGSGGRSSAAMPVIRRTSAPHGETREQHGIVLTRRALGCFISGTEAGPSIYAMRGRWDGSTGASPSLLVMTTTTTLRGPLIPGGFALHEVDEGERTRATVGLHRGSGWFEPSSIDRRVEWALPQWVDDGRIAFDRGVWLIRLADSYRRRLNDPDDHEVYSFDITADARWLVYDHYNQNTMSGPGGGGISRIRLDGTRHERARVLEGPERPSWISPRPPRWRDDRLQGLLERLAALFHPSHGRGRFQQEEFLFVM